MTTEILDISWSHIALTTLLVLLTGICSVILKLKIEKELFVGTIRTFLQLILLGYVLKFVFDLNNPVLVIIIFSLMIYFAARIITGRVRESKIPYFIPVIGSMFLSYMIINIFIMTVIIQVEPWYMPVYFIPIGGMIIGNSMNALSISIDNWFEGIKKDRFKIEQYLALGGTPSESTAINFREALRAGMIPSINAMMSVGIVSIPGMMTGQMLAGIDPMIAIKYQIVIMLLLVGSTAFSAILALHIVRQLSFTAYHQIKL